MSQENVDAARALYAAFSRRDRVSVEKLLDDDFVADMSRSLGPEKGIYDRIEFLGTVLDAYEDAWETYEIAPAELSVGEDTVVVATEGRGVGRHSGVEATARGGHLLKFRGCKIVRWTLYQTHQDALEAAGLSE